AMYCPKCGKQNSSTSAFCVSCGAPIVQQQPIAYSSKGWVFGAIGASVVALGLLVALVIVLLNKPPEPNGSPEPNPPPGVSLPFYDDFRSLNTRVWAITSCEWSVEQGVLLVTRGRQCFAYVKDGLSWTNYAVEVDIYRASRGSNYPGIIVRAQDGMNYVVFYRFYTRLCWDIVKGGNRIGRCMGGVDKILPEKVRVRVEVYGDRYEAYIDGIRESQIQDPTFDRGMPGLYVGDKDSPPVAFANFKVMALDK
ncbi:MAG: zinc-ribbon domain-containing protein, partial [Candidatus Caldarchaeum sp.]